MIWSFLKETRDRNGCEEYCKETVAFRRQGHAFYTNDDDDDDDKSIYSPS
jgi:hypothetical protein